LLEEANMTQVYFHCSTTEHVMVGRRHTTVADLAEACEHANRYVQTLLMTPNEEDWRGWILHATDEVGEELFIVPFASMLGKLH